jgi:MSHA biogenesis protein MshO
MGKQIRHLARRAAGFTLIEIIAVIVVMGILAVLGGKFVMESSRSYQSTKSRTELVNVGRQASERMSRQLRVALPYSVRITNSGNCLEFMPIASGGNYRDQVPDAVNSGTASATIYTSPFQIEFGSATYVAIGAMSAAEVYGASSLASLAAPINMSSTPSSAVTLSAPKVWLRNSVNQRFYLLNAPQAFCIVGNQLRFYENQPLTGVVLGSAFSLMADNVTAVTPFSLSAGSENRNTNVNFDITFVDANPLGQTLSLTFNQSVMIRNVP